ncbi:hypothetical protein OAS39_00385 [Pirellulales bacterium]|nr:hypothetical protein [Pirellulales bacterium]
MHPFLNPLANRVAARPIEVRSRRVFAILWGAAIVLLVHYDLARGQLEFERDPINYGKTLPTGPVARLQERLDRGEVSLVYDEHQGYLRSLLGHLDIPISSQMLVFSKTSFQPRRISPRRPRAVYFSDDVFVGWVQGGDVVEISAADPQLGAVFYTLEQDRTDAPEIVRDRGQCIICHASSRTEGVPGHLVRSVYADLSGQPNFGSGTFTTDYRSPFKERWGGWYVTGTHGTQRHMGNVTAKDRQHAEKLDQESGANVTELSTLMNVAPYLAPHSDIVALMVLEHQTRMHNLLTRANFETRAACHYDQIINKALGRSADTRSESTQRRIESAGDKLVDGMLFVDEFVLRDPVKGTSSFSQEFAARGPHDSQGRSLRELDLARRLMKYPCSYLIYSDPFEQLPSLAKEYVYRRLYDVLSEADTSKRYAHLSSSDRQAILEILRDTKSDLPDFWKTSS